VTHRILLFENTIRSDSANFRALSEIGQVIRAHSLLEATAQCLQLHPDLVVADCPVDGLDCAQVAQELRSNDCDAALLALSYANDFGPEAPPFTVLTKPVRASDLLETARRVLDGRRLN
jgi:DNA-binding response OmpR family regulator